MTNDDRGGCYIGGCVRNCAAHLPSVFANIRAMSSAFSECTIIIAYDESTDGSLAILRGFVAQFPRMTILINSKPLSRMRTENIANARNSILGEINRQELVRQELVRQELVYKYFIMMDMDDVCASPINTSVLSRYLGAGEVDRWDSLSFNRPGYYDIWALSLDPYLISCWHWDPNPVPPSHFGSREVTTIMGKYVIDRLAALRDDELLECYSAFNGFAIYKLSHFSEGSYDHNFLSSLKLIPSQLIQQNMAVLGRQFNMYSIEDCEHRYFHFQAIVSRQARIRISPCRLF